MPELYDIENMDWKTFFAGYIDTYLSRDLKEQIEPKVIFMDSGLCSYLVDFPSARDLQLSSLSGHYLETFIISEIIKSYNAIGEDPNITYYRDKDKNEIDLIFSKGNKLYPFEIKRQLCRLLLW